MKFSKQGRERKAAIATMRKLIQKMFGPPCKTWCPSCIVCEAWWGIARLDVMMDTDERKPCKH
jgi:hypothetical protein